MWRAGGDPYFLYNLYFATHFKGFEIAYKKEICSIYLLKIGDANKREISANSVILIKHEIYV